MKSVRFVAALSAAAVGFASLLGSSLATAQESGPLEEIVVTAAYREQGLQDVPVSISAVTGDTMVEAAIQKAEDIQFVVPNFTLTETGIGTNAFIRGIGSGINQAFEQSVGTYIDGVHYGRAQQWRAPFLDVERVEVLRGPQSILFGKNSVAGAVNITTARPTDELLGSVMLSQEFENQEFIAEAMISGPFTDRFRGRLAARTRILDGHMRNATLGTDEPSREDWTVRGTFEFDVTDNLMATLKIEEGEFDVTGRNIEIINEQPAAGGPFAGAQYNQILQLFGGDPSTGNVTQDEIRSSNGDFSNNKSTNYVLTLDWGIGNHDVKSISAWSEFEYDEFCDCDFTGTVVFGAALQESYEQFSQEIRISSPLGGKFDYIAGVYYQTSDHDYDDQIIVAGNSVLVPIVNALSPGSGDLLANTEAQRRATVDSDVLSGFAQFNFHVSDNLTLQAGGRITQDDRDGFRTLAITSAGGSALPAPQIASPLVYGQLFGISSTNLLELAALPVPPLAGPANALLYGVDLSMGGVPCTSIDPVNCVGGLGVLPVEGSRDDSKFSPEVKAIWNMGDDSLMYLSWSEGFKSGSFDFRANNRNFFPTMQDSFEFDDEEASNIELGAKTLLADGRLELNAALFFTEFDDLQISIFDGTLGFNVGNAASAEAQGLELDWRWAATDNLLVRGGLAFTDFEFTDFENGQCFFGATPDTDLDGDGTPELCSYTGNSNQLVSDVQGNLTFDYGVPFGNGKEFGATLDLFYTSEYDASATFDPALVQDDYTLINLRLAIGADDGSWQLALLGKNLGDEQILTFGGDTPLSGSTFGAKSNYAFYSPGTTYSLQGLFRF